MTNEQTSEPTTNETVVGRCADSGGTEGQQEQASGGEGFNGKIAFTLNSDIYVVDGEGAHESRLTHTAQVFEQDPVWSPDGKKIAFTTQDQSDLSVINVDGTKRSASSPLLLPGTQRTEQGLKVQSGHPPATR
jgi:WD40-like Beta Propeller Repeat